VLEKADAILNLLLDQSLCKEDTNSKEPDGQDSQESFSMYTTSCLECDVVGGKGPHQFESNPNEQASRSAAESKQIQTSTDLDTHGSSPPKTPKTPSGEGEENGRKVQQVDRHGDERQPEVGLGAVSTVTMVADSKSEDEASKLR
jgi:hypothetical protein